MVNCEPAAVGSEFAAANDDPPPRLDPSRRRAARSPRHATRGQPPLGRTDEWGRTLTADTMRPLPHGHRRGPSTAKERPPRGCEVGCHAPSAGSKWCGRSCTTNATMTCPRLCSQLTRSPPAWLCVR